jgi:hypothetical protein
LFNAVDGGDEDQMGLMKKIVGKRREEMEVGVSCGGELWEGRKGEGLVGIM